MPRINDQYYVAPDWTNGTAPYINAEELTAISKTLENLPIKNGGTGATTAAQALENLGGLAKSGVTNKGDNTSPVYFNAEGIATPISTIHLQVSDSSQSPLVGDIYKWGKVVMITLRQYTKDSGGASTSYSGVIPSGYRPVQQAYGFMFGTSATSAGSDIEDFGLVSINTSGTVKLQASDKNMKNLYYRFTMTYLTE